MHRRWRMKPKKGVPIEQTRSLQLLMKEIRENEEDLTPEEEKELLRKFQEEGDIEARNRVISRHLRFAISFAKFYTGTGAPQSDLISVAVDGLIEAANRYDCSSSNKFLSYAVWWMRLRVYDYLRQVRLPYVVPARLTYLMDRCRQLEQALGRPLTVADLQESFNLDSVDARVLYELYSPHRGEGISDNEEENEDEANEIPATYTNEIEDEDHLAFTRVMLMEAIKKECGEKIASAIFKMYGLVDGFYHSLAVVAEEYSLPVRALEAMINECLERTRQYLKPIL